MAFTKAHRFKPGDYHFSLVCHALSHPARLSMIRKLQNHHKCPASELIRGLPIGQPSASQHLRMLREMQLVRYEEVYPTVFYWLNADLPGTCQMVSNLLAQAEGHANLMTEHEISALSRVIRASAQGF